MTFPDWLETQARARAPSSYSRTLKHLSWNRIRDQLSQGILCALLEITFSSAGFGVWKWIWRRAVAERVFLMKC